MEAFISQVADILTHPWAIVSRTALSIVAIVVSLVAVKKTIEIAKLNKQNIQAEQARFVERQWSDIDALIVQNEKVAEIAAEAYGKADALSAQQEAFYFLHLNLIMGVQVAYEQGVLNDEDYNDHWSAFLNDLGGNPNLIRKLMKSGALSESFQKEMERRLKLVS